MAQFQPPKPERYRVWWVPRVPMPSFKYEVPDLATAYLMTDLLAKYDLFQYENRVKGDYAYTGGVQRWVEEDQEWEDVDEAEVRAAWAEAEVNQRWPNHTFKLSDNATIARIDRMIDQGGPGL